MTRSFFFPTRARSTEAGKVQGRRRLDRERRAVGGIAFERLESRAMLSGSGGVFAAGTATDDLGNSYVAGSFSGTVDFDPGASVANLTAVGRKDAFVVKLDAGGGFVWARRFGSWGEDEANAIAIDPASGDLVVGGEFTGTVSFDASNPRGTLMSHGREDGFILVLDSDGNTVWAEQFGGIGDDNIESIAVDELGNIVAVGTAEGILPAAAGQGFVGASNRDSDDEYDYDDEDVAFVLALDSTGTERWLNVIDATVDVEADSVAVAIDGTIVVGGSFEGSVFLDPLVDTPTFRSRGLEDGFVAAYDTDGVLLWAHQFGGVGEDSVNGVAVDANGNVYAVGEITGAVGLDPTVLSTASSRSSSRGRPRSHEDGFVVSLDVTGGYRWSQVIASTRDDSAEAVAIDGLGNVIVVGEFEGRVDFDPSAAAAVLTSLGGEDAFVVTYGANGSYRWARAFGGRGDDGFQAVAANSSGIITAAGKLAGAFSARTAGSRARESYRQTAFAVGLDALAGTDWIASFLKATSSRPNRRR